MFICDYNAFRSIESLYWVVSNNYSKSKNQLLGIL